jgi:signal transduction histidine kinase
MAATDKLEAVRKLEARALSWIIFAMALVASPVILLVGVSEVRAGRFDVELGFLVGVHVVSLAVLLLVRGVRFRAIMVIFYTLVAGCVAMLHYGPLMSVGLTFLAAVALARIYIGMRMSLIVLGVVALLLAAAGVLNTSPGAPFYDPAGSDPTSALTWIRMGFTTFGLIACIALLFGIINDGIASVAREAQAALERERREKDERRTAERALAESQRQEIVSRVAAGAAHDLNNILTAVMGAADLAALYASDPAGVRKELALISDSVDRASALTRQLLSFSRHQVTQQKRVNLAEIVRALEGLVQRLTPSNIEISVDTARDLPPIDVDPAQIEQVILNLCVNARDAMPEGGRLSIRLFEAPLAGGAPGVAVSVSDTGSGISEDVRERMFDPFFTTKAEGRGTGLGLATVRIIVNAHGGDIRCESRVQEGTTMTVILPRADADAKPSHAPPLAAVAAESRGRGESILLCDDDASICATGVRILERAGYEVQAISDGANAIPAAASRRFDLVVIDAVMPGGGGRQLYDSLRRDHPEMRFLFSTGYDPGVFGQEFFDDPRHHLLPKPYGRTDLLRAVREVLDET